MNTLSYKFEELPIIVEGKIVAGLISGTADIRYFDNGEWSIASIDLDGYLGTERRSVTLEDRSWLFLTICVRLETEFAPFIEDRVNCALENDGIVWRTDYQEHNTHHYAASGAR